MSYVERTDQEITEAFRQVIDDRTYWCGDNPRDEYDTLLEEMENDTPIGKSFIAERRKIAKAADVDPIKKILQDFSKI